MSSTSSLLLPTYAGYPSPSESLKEEFMETDEKIISITIAKLDNMIFEATHLSTSISFLICSSIIAVINDLLVLIGQNELHHRYPSDILESRFTKLLRMLIIKSFFRVIKRSWSYNKLLLVVTPCSFECISSLLGFLYETANYYKIQLEDEVTLEILLNIKELKIAFKEYRLAITPIDGSKFHVLKLDQWQLSLLDNSLHQMNITIVKNCRLSNALLYVLRDEKITINSIEEFEILFHRYHEINDVTIRRNFYMLFRSLISKVSWNNPNFDKYPRLLRIHREIDEWLTINNVYSNKAGKTTSASLLHHSPESHRARVKEIRMSFLNPATIAAEKTTLLSCRSNFNSSSEIRDIYSMDHLSENLSLIAPKNKNRIWKVFKRFKISWLINIKRKILTIVS